MIVRHAVLDVVRAHARGAAPRECCGMLIGSGEQIERAVPARNLEPGPSRFLIDPADHIAARRTARAEGLEVLGFYHSHPASAAWPSASDLADANYPEAVHLIVGYPAGIEEIRLFTLRPDRAVGVPFELA